MSAPVTTPDKLIELALRASGPSKLLDREIALAVGWVRQTPSEAGRRHPAWFHPDDCRGGKPVMDSLHGTDVWRDPLEYTASLDAAMQLVPEGLAFGCGRGTNEPDVEGWAWCGPDEGAYYFAATPALALCAASLRAKATQEAHGG